jgi:hypothetical protein
MALAVVYASSAVFGRRLVGAVAVLAYLCFMLHSIMPVICFFLLVHSFQSPGACCNKVIMSLAITAGFFLDAARCDGTAAGVPELGVASNLQKQINALEWLVANVGGASGMEAIGALALSTSRPHSLMDDMKNDAIQQVINIPSNVALYMAIIGSYVIALYTGVCILWSGFKGARQRVCLAGGVTTLPGFMAAVRLDFLLHCLSTWRWDLLWLSPTSPLFRTHPLSGKWQGSVVTESKNKIDLSANLRFFPDYTLRGEGVDDVGKFIVEGCWRQNSRVAQLAAGIPRDRTDVVFCKRYIGVSTTSTGTMLLTPLEWDFQGVVNHVEDEHHIAGTWSGSTTKLAFGYPLIRHLQESESAGTFMLSGRET